MTTRPTRRQVDVARAAVEWYLATHYGKPGDVGLVDTFCDRQAVGAFAVDRASLESGEDDALFRLLVTVAMFQRLRDSLVKNILRGISRRDVEELSSLDALCTLAAESECKHLRENSSLLGTCDLTKNARKQGTCTVEPSVRCHVKRHTELLRRYGHFGKMPTSAALSVRELGGSMSALRERVIEEVSDPQDRSRALEQHLSSIWRISDKLANMYLSLVAAPLMGLATPPWRDGIDWTWFVVVDSNVDLFLRSIKYAGNGTYSARRAFVRALAEKIDLQSFDASLPSFHPRLVQQALFLFMSRSNRRAASSDCCHEGAVACRTCPSTLKARCPVVFGLRQQPSAIGG